MYLASAWCYMYIPSSRYYYIHVAAYTCSSILGALLAALREDVSALDVLQYDLQYADAGHTAVCGR
jgi:hypothetical protein